MLEERCGIGVQGVYFEDRRTSASQLLERILNQNEQSLGLFYLYPDNDAGIDVHAVALLRVTISFRVEHYKVLEDARRGRLSNEFGAKLGWLAGNLYSRVATSDWTETESRTKEFRKLVSRFLEGDDASEQKKWVSRAWVDAARKKDIDLRNLSAEIAYETLKDNSPLPPKQVAIDRVMALATDLFGDAQANAVEKLAKRLGNDQVFTASCKRA